MKVAFLRAWEDRTWDTIVFDVPDEATDDSMKIDWLFEQDDILAANRRVCFWAVYSTFGLE